ncbi:uncharacterized protein LOC18435649 isoform X2 [Amborella trichopoda]|uniref:uncharacterized protein LOC18435649 isoform X2 n=1 Tax=Amborella trichopoda TaxID=13333 RepID=UPI0009BD8261|nr:uncharacterized protein LOC18435649 isoform X2 [Amborella trichopoda]|eukprot:XP_020523677.1 uncharacterized protein LOC18435649 isoform X2 [Amborella trichopoda]
MYVATLREQLEQLMGESTLEGFPSISKAKINDYSEKIEAIATKLASDPLPDTLNAVHETPVEGRPFKAEEVKMHASVSPGLRRRLVSHKEGEGRTQEISEREPVKLDASAQEHVEKHRKLQEDLTDEMVGLARQLKESSLMMSQSLHDTEKILDSTERAVEQSLASTGQANAKAMQVYSESFKTSCFTWLLMFGMACIFFFVVLLIRVT